MNKDISKVALVVFYNALKTKNIEAKAGMLALLEKIDSRRFGSLKKLLAKSSRKSERTLKINQ